MTALTKLEDLKQQLLRHAPLHSWRDLAGRRDLPPASSGVYAWFFTPVPPGVPIENCVEREGRHLLYVGISPSSLTSTATLRSRLRQHFTGTAEGSTFRLTLGCLLEAELRTVLRRVGSGKRMTFGPQETALTRLACAARGRCLGRGFPAVAP
jgi:GIY-YIG catalytic domain-containing protein